MFPKAHAAAYVMNAFRIAYYKINYPLAYYAAMFSIRVTTFDYVIMAQGRAVMENHAAELEKKPDKSQKEEDMLKDMLIVREMYARGFEFMPSDIYKADAKKFLIEKDAEAFEPLAKAYSIPKEEPGRDEILEKSLYEAALAPLEIVKKSKEVSELISELVIKGSRLAISDVGVAASACEACAKGASMNVYINTKLMKNRDVAAKLNEQTLSLVADVCSACSKAYDEVKGGLGA